MPIDVESSLDEWLKRFPTRRNTELFREGMEEPCNDYLM
jgi:hypothetical protein